MKKGFTLNELLIAITIVGIIMVVAIPRVTSNMDKKAKVAAIQRAHYGINEAVSNLMLKERAKNLMSSSLYAEDSNYSVVDNIGAFLNQYFKVRKDCGTTVSDCLASGYKNISGQDVSIPGDNDAYCVIVNTGAAICVAPAEEEYPMVVWVDTNAKKIPNTAGRDFFRFFIYEDGFISDGLSMYGSDINLDPYWGAVELEPQDCLDNTNGGGCLTRLMRNEWNMDY